MTAARSNRLVPALAALTLAGACASEPSAGPGTGRVVPADSAVTAATAGPVVAPPTTEPPPLPLRDRVLFGAFVPGAHADTAVTALEERLGAPLEVTSSFPPWGYVFGGPADGRLAAGGARRVLHAWEPFGLRFTAFTNGSQDGYLQRIVDSMQAYPHDVWVRPWPEMNASWSSWQPTTRGDKPAGGTAAEFVAAWRHVVAFVRDRGVHNLLFVFNPDTTISPASTPVAQLWPGADYVDAIGLDGYNWGDDRAGNHWREFEAIFAPMYDIVTALPGDRPVWITEVGSKEPAAADGAPANRARDKGRWIDGMLGSTAFPRVQVVAWFNIAKERDWRLESSPAALAATREQLAARRRSPPGA